MPLRRLWGVQDASATAVGHARCLSGGPGARTTPPQPLRDAHDAFMTVTGRARCLCDCRGLRTMPPRRPFVGHVMCVVNDVSLCGWLAKVMIYMWFGGHVSLRAEANTGPWHAEASTTLYCTDLTLDAFTEFSCISVDKSKSHLFSKNVFCCYAFGNMLHLIVDACISRNLIDTSAYFWPGYVVPSALSKDSTSFQDSPWSTFLEGAPLTGSLKSSLMMTPTSSFVEVEKMYNVALIGSEEEKLAAAKILCGASLLRGWNVQEHVVRIVVKMLSPPMPSDSSAPGAGNYLIGHMPVLSAILFAISGVDTVHILSLYGMVPEVAATLMPLCEFFGSLSPLSSHRSSTSEESSVYTVFSCAFLFLLRLWKFYKPPQEHCIAGRGGPVRLELTLDYLLLMHNSRLGVQNSPDADRLSLSNAPPSQPVYIDSFPRLRAWYFQNQACIASTLSGLSSKNPVHQLANKILSMICRKMSKCGPVSGNPSSNSSSSISGSPVNSTEDSFQRPMLPAWEILEALPFVLEAVLTACAHGRLSSRELTTGLRDLMDFLPASIAAIISYFSAEITRGIWKPVSLNGTDWPSPSPTLLSMESEIKEILASVGVHINSCYPRKRAVAQLIRSCFTSFLGPSVSGDSHIIANRGVNGLLGQFMSDEGARLPVPPGFLYLRTFRNFHDTHFVNEVIFKLVIEWAHKLANEWASGGPACLKSGRTSLAAAASGVQEVATLGASLLCIAGGVQMVQILYEETLPTLLLSTSEEKLGGAGPVSNILQGYAMAYMLILCGSFVWGNGNTSPAYTSVFSSRRTRVIGIHMDFIAGAVGGNIILGCDPATWKAYVSCFVGLLVKFAPAWVGGVKQETLQKLASGLRGWHECDLAISLLERGGPSSMAAVVEWMT
ncbi:hypothetical protein ZIOFF_033320 [Zingiber officinale]|uniref:Mediator of RNA polymerase II transcription subunit 33A n=1 Tax=Zingiber officinale TaxID=94328 RepID=A0A8J5L727_ZINOF|nr:hypothetical protein ZIOFF_033320 [Zingiber officinale]